MVKKGWGGGGTETERAIISECPRVVNRQFGGVHKLFHKPLTKMPFFLKKKKKINNNCI